MKTVTFRLSHLLRIGDRLGRAGPMPFTFSVDGDKMTIVEGIRENWKPQGVEVIEHMVPYLNEITVRPPKLANAFVTREIPYSWEKGRTETLQI